MIAGASMKTALVSLNSCNGADRLSSTSARRCLSVKNELNSSAIVSALRVDIHAQDPPRLASTLWFPPAVCHRLSFSLSSSASKGTNGRRTAGALNGASRASAGLISSMFRRISSGNLGGAFGGGGTLAAFALWRLASTLAG